MPYLLDANVFIEAKNRHYGLDFCPAFWNWIIDKHKQQCVYSINKINEELCTIEDELSYWVTNVLDPKFFLDEQDSLTASLTTVSAWVTNQTFSSGEKYRRDAVATFLANADYYLIAQALDRGFTIVTHERQADTPTKVRIPNVCLGVNVKPITPYDMLREERARFVLPGSES